MKIIKTSIYALAISTILVSCGASAPIVAPPIGNVSSTPTKNVALTEDELKQWGAMDLVTDTVPGMSVDRAYREIIKNRKGKPVIVGVIDSGTDIEHEDLKNVLWTNPGEIAGNGIDDDNNGFIDDVHGWNFLGDILGENMEYVRIVRKLGPKYEGKEENTINTSDREEFAIYQKAKAEFEKELQETAQNRERYQQMVTFLRPAHDAMVAKLGKNNYTQEDLNNFENPTPMEQQQIAMLSQMLGFGETVPEVLEQLDNGLSYFQSTIDNHFNTTTDFRSVLGDDPDDITDNIYGDPNVASIDPTRDNVKHGTHVAGIIAAERNNGIGTDGVANNVTIMALRPVPDGDEYDKDIALS